MSDRVKFYKNKNRGEEEKYQPYVPNYVSLGVEPQEMIFSASRTSNEETAVKSPKTRPVVVNTGRRVNQPYAEAVTSPIGENPVPNVGNNMEHTWSSLDGEIIDDVSHQAVPGHHRMIDNNDYVSEQALGGPTFGGAQRNRPFPMPSLKNEEETDDRPTLTDLPAFQPEGNNLHLVLKDLEPGSYLLLVKGEPICSGPLKEIEEATNALILGNHVLFDGSPIPEEDILILKRANIKVGVFLDKE